MQKNIPNLWGPVEGPHTDSDRGSLKEANWVISLFHGFLMSKMSSICENGVLYPSKEGSTKAKVPYECFITFLLLLDTVVKCYTTWP